MRVKFPDGKIKELRITGKMLIEEILKEFGILIEEVIVAKNGKVVPEDEMVVDEDEIKIINVLHGG